MSNPSKRKGTEWEVAVVEWLRWALDDNRIDRTPPKGVNDEGDIAGVWFHGMRVVVECKATRRASYSAHWGETLVEMGHADTPLGVVFWKRPGIGLKLRSSMARHLAYMDNDTYRRFRDLLPPDARASLAGMLKTVPRHKDDMTGMTVATFARILNSWQPLGPDDPEGSDSE